MDCRYIYSSYISSMAIFDVRSLTVKKGGKIIIDNLSFTVNEGEHWAVTGPSGSGKTTLLNVLSGNHSYQGSVIASSERKEKTVLVEQQHRFRNLSNTSNFYYQQRFNSNDSEDAITVEEALLNTVTGNSGQVHDKQFDDTVDLLKIRHLLSTRLIQLSNGENKRLQIAKALLAQPTVLLLDNPFIGLDAASRETLHAMLEEMGRRSITVILVTANNQVPGFITHVIDLGKGKVILPEAIHAFRQSESGNGQHDAYTMNKILLEKLHAGAQPVAFEFAVKMKDVRVQYNNRQILNHINWEVRQGERWSLSGPNGSGKSTLLSLINADNPQAYSNEIYLFDRRRGTGESIWDIKRKIGFVSPELHLFFDGSNNCFEVIASGLFDTIGLFRMVNDDQARLIMNWMDLLNISALKLKPLFQLSNSQQRLVLLARALVKNPPLLILDEPCQGLDDDQIAFFKDIVNDICIETGKTLIYVSHYPHEIPSCVDRYLRLESGSVSGEE